MMRFLRWLLSLFGIGNPVAVDLTTGPIPVYIVPKPEPPDPPGIQPPKVVGRGTLNANFLAFAPNWEMADNRQGDCGLFYYRWSAEKRAQFREEYTAAGYTDLPICVMPGGDGLPSTKEGSLDLAYELEEELHASGMR